MTDTTGIGELVKRAREIERGVDGPDWRHGQMFYRAGYESKAIALMPQLVNALEAAEREHDDLLQSALGISAERDQAADALEAAQRVIAFYAEKNNYFSHDGAFGLHLETAVETDQGKTGRDWLARHATGQKGGGR